MVTAHHLQFVGSERKGKAVTKKMWLRFARWMGLAVVCAIIAFHTSGVLCNILTMGFVGAIAIAVVKTIC